MHQACNECEPYNTLCDYVTLTFLSTVNCVYLYKQDISCAKRLYVGNLTYISFLLLFAKTTSTGATTSSFVLSSCHVSSPYLPKVYVITYFSMFLLKNFKTKAGTVAYLYGSYNQNSWKNLNSRQRTSCKRTHRSINFIERSMFLLS